MRLFRRQYQVKESAGEMWILISVHKGKRSVLHAERSKNRAYNLLKKGRLDNLITFSLLVSLKARDYFNFMHSTNRLVQRLVNLLHHKEEVII